MTALIACETVLLVLLVLLVAGLLRSHAEILRRLGPPAVEPDIAPTIPRPDARAGGRHAKDIVGQTLEHDAVKFSMGGGAQATLLAFLSSGCSVCEGFWNDLRASRRAGRRDAAAGADQGPKRGESLSPAAPGGRAHFGCHVLVGLARLRRAGRAVLRVHRRGRGARRGVGNWMDSDRVAATRRDRRSQTAARRRGSDQRGGSGPRDGRHRAGSPQPVPGPRG